MAFQPTIDLASIFALAQQTKARDLAERQFAAQQAEQAQVMQMRERQMAQLEQQRAAEQEARAMAGKQQQQIIGLRRAAVQGDVDAIQQLTAVAPDDPWLKLVNEQALKSRDATRSDTALAAQQEQAKRANALGWANLRDERSAREAKSKADAATGAEKKSGDMLKGAGELRKEFQALPVVKDTQTLRSAYEKIANTSETGAGDMSMIFAYMKMLDPGSTVREGEYATAQNAGSVPQNILAAYNRALSGQKLDPNVRQSFRVEAGKLWQGQLGQYEQAAGQYRSLAEKAGYKPEDVVLNFGYQPARQSVATGSVASQGSEQAASAGTIGGRSFGGIESVSTDDLMRMLEGG